ncbi:MAG TPA: hypothetical protein VLZ83_05340 [Edaphocola sp.]|nr:hypothetical protein [Edaphocola sp.]
MKKWWIRNSYICMLFLCSCAIKQKAADEVWSWDSSKLELPEILRYDTLEGLFLREISIQAYMIGDGIHKGDDFIKQGEVLNETLYNNGIITSMSSYFWYDAMKEKRPDFHFDTISIFNALWGMELKSIQGGSKWFEPEISPICDSYYKRYRMKIEVLNLGLIKQRLPLFMNCEQIAIYEKENHGKNYQILAIPTYLITKIFSWEEL